MQKKAPVGRKMIVRWFLGNTGIPADCCDWDACPCRIFKLERTDGEAQQ